MALDAVLLGGVAVPGVVVDVPLAPIPDVLVLLPGVVTVVDVLALGVVVTLVELSRPDVRVVVDDWQPAASAATRAIATSEVERCNAVMGSFPSKR